MRALSCAVLATLLLASCGGGSGGTGPTVTSDTTSPTTAETSSNTSTTSPTETSSTNSSSSPTTTETSSNTSTTSPTTTPTTNSNSPNVTSPASNTTPVSTAPATSVGPFGQDASRYELTFSDEFNGTSLNRNVWNDTIWYEPSNPTRNYAVEDGKLKIWPQRDASGKFFNRTIDTDYKYYQTYGYFEIEAKLPMGKGVWPAFWLFNHIGSRRPEIDIMEAYPGGGPNSGWGDANLRPVAFAATVWRDQTVNAGHKTLHTHDLSAGFNKYAVKWEPGKQTFYFNGKEFYTLNVSMGDPMYIMLDLWFGSASGQPDSTTPTGKGNSYEVNYVRAWRMK